jgi:hypothetical protein
MRVIVTTSNKYLHLIPVFTYLFNKYWSSEQEVTILGYDKPKCELPANFTFHSMGKQGDVSEWSTDLRKYFKQMPDWHFIWLMEDTLIKSVNIEGIERAYFLIKSNFYTGRFDLTKDIQKRAHQLGDSGIIRAGNDTTYKLSTQPSIWNKRFLMNYLTDGLTPWAFEKQDKISPGWSIKGLDPYPVKHNEGVRKSDPHKLDLNGFPEEDVKHIKSLL